MKTWMTGAAILAIAAGTTHAHAQTAPVITADATAASSATANAAAAAAPAATSDDGDPGTPDDGSIVVVGQAVSFANTRVTKAMIERQSALSSVNDVINELPGVSVQEGDAFGSSDWATSISIRGFSQVGTTIDGVPNGGSGYGGGSKANRYIDVMDLKTVEVSQGTADISSRSNEALGGTLNYLTSDPENDFRLRLSGAAGDFGAQKYYVRVDTGEIAPDTRAYVSASHSKVHDWIGGAGKTTRDHIDAKIVSRVSNIDLTGFLSYDDANESEFGSVSVASFEADPNHDAYTDNWTGIPYIDQSYRAGSRALRKNLLGYLRAKTELGELKLSATGYYHRMRGRGDWLPPYLVDVGNNGTGSTVVGGDALGEIYFVNPDGTAATMTAGCTGTANVPAEYSPSCYSSDATAVMSYRHTHYKNDRYGATADADWTHDFGVVQNSVRAGAWVEHAKLNTLRDWHKVNNAAVGMAYDDTPYWVQFSTDYVTDEFVYYAQDALTFGKLTASFGVKQYFLDQTRQELLDDRTRTSINSHSKPLISAGLTWESPVEGLELFAGYAQNFAAIDNGVLDSDQATVNSIKPETANSWEVGARYSSSHLQASLTGYDIKFDNHIVSISSNLVTGIDYLEQEDSVYLNVGGVRSRGVEAAVAYRFDMGLTLSANYSYNHAVYIGTGDAEQDADVGITPGVQVTNSPRHMWVLSADYKRSIFKGGVAAKFVGDRFIDTEGSQVAPGYTVLNGYVGVDLGGISDTLKGASFTLQATNLTDKRYLAGADGGSAFLGAPRTITGSLTLDF
ncbi:TonB-dependent receptor domain-containing protein [Novosphingobium sp. 9]|uniref:TonB-dependent receptor domain-containing protein n=1 Tax=Novosphingobium sp. 9 TaxID=2025349 RepID=UPI0021B4FF3F|nr:TonB-dependent receptor [Novosphingobium sp. 9]